MPRYLFTTVALVIAVLAFIYESSGYFFVRVSPETKLSIHRETHRVTVGRSSDGMLSISQVTDVPSAPMQERYANRTRTLRAHIASNNSGIPTIYLETSRPHNFYVIDGAFTVSPKASALTWIASTKLLFYGVINGTPARFTVDVHDLTMSTEIVEVLPVAETHDMSDVSI